MMKKFLMFLALATALALPAAGIAAESFTVTAVSDTDAANIGAGWAKSFKTIKVEWKANGSNGTMVNQTIPAHKGRVLLGVTNPGTTQAPTDNYDLYILDSEGVDIFGGELNNRSTTASQQAAPLLDGTAYYGPRPIYGPMTFSISGNSQTDADGVLFLYIEE